MKLFFQLSLLLSRRRFTPLINNNASKSARYWLAALFFFLITFLCGWAWVLFYDLEIISVDYFKRNIPFFHIFFFNIFFCYTTSVTFSVCSMAVPVFRRYFLDSVICQHFNFTYYKWNVSSGKTVNVCPYELNSIILTIQWQPDYFMTFCFGHLIQFIVLDYGLNRLIIINSSAFF